MPCLAVSEGLHTVAAAAKMAFGDDECPLYSVLQLETLGRKILKKNIRMPLLAMASSKLKGKVSQDI